MGNFKYNSQLISKIRRSTKKTSNYNPKGADHPPLT
jgi:hypothetical protein